MTVSVQDFGALGNGIHDDSAAVQRALDSLKETGGEVLVPPGLYRMLRGVTVPRGVHVVGQTTACTGPWQNLLDSRDKGFPDTPGTGLTGIGEQWIDPAFMRGSWFLSEHDPGNADGPATFRLEGETSIRKVGFVNRFLPPVAATVTPCPPNIAHISANDLPHTREGVTVEDISLANSYIGIVIAAGKEIENTYPNFDSPMDLSHSCGRHRIHNVMGGPVYRGIVLKCLLDTVDVHNCQFNYSNYEPLYVQARAENCVDLLMCRGDGMNFSNILSFGANKSLQTLPSFRNHSGICSFRLTGCNFEAVIPMDLQSGGLYEIANSYFLCLHPLGYGRNSPAVCFRFRQPPGCPHNPFLAVSNCVFQNAVGNAGSFADIELTCGAFPSFDNCQFWGWGPDRPLFRVFKSVPKTGAVSVSHSVFIGTAGIDTPQEQNPGVLAETGGVGFKSGDLTFAGCRMPANLTDETSDRVWFDRCIRFQSNGENQLFTRL